MAEADRGYVSQFSRQDIGITVTVASTPTNADGDVRLLVANEDSESALFERVADHVGTGQYQSLLTQDDTAALGNYRAQWSFLLNGAQQVLNTYFAIGGAEPAYDRLPEDMKSIVDQVWVLFADQFDSPSGGPNLQTWAMSNFNRGRIAQLLPRALGILNTVAQPFSTYTVDGVGGSAFPVLQWGPLLSQSLYVEVLKHLQRSYLEQPDWEGGAGISRLDRRSYRQYYGELVAQEQEQLRLQLDHFKIRQMGLSRPSLLVSGGVFGRYSSVNRPYMAARPRMWFAAAF